MYVCIYRAYTTGVKRSLKSEGSSRFVLLFFLYCIYKEVNMNGFLASEPMTVVDRLRNVCGSRHTICAKHYTHHHKGFVFTLNIIFHDTN